jgi:biopolymer transport protein ExbB/TolQ
VTTAVALLAAVLAVAAYVVLVRWVLPRLGVET